MPVWETRRSWFERKWEERKLASIWWPTSCQRFFVLWYRTFKYSWHLRCYLLNLESEAQNVYMTWLRPLIDYSVELGFKFRNCHVIFNREFFIINFSWYNWFICSFIWSTNIYGELSVCQCGVPGSRLNAWGVSEEKTNRCLCPLVAGWGAPGHYCLSRAVASCDALANR